MLGGKLAKLAGITPRALRHYRNMGLLEDLQQNESGYFEYNMDHFIRILKIKNLTGLGFSLEKVRQILDRENHVNGIYLDVLDQELQIEIQQLEKKRQTIAVLKNNNLSADTPAAFAEFIELLYENDIPGDLLLREWDGFLIFEHILKKEDLKLVTDFYKQLITAGLFDEYCSLEKQLYQLKGTPAPKQAQIEEVARRYADFFLKMGKNEISIDNGERLELVNELVRLYDGEEFQHIQQQVAECIIKIINQ